MRLEKRAQGWGFDVMMASMLFLVGMIIFYVYAINNSSQTEETYNLLSYDGNSIASSLLSEGSPADWNSTNVVFIGLISNNEINGTKLERFYNLSKENYNATRAIFNTVYDYYMNFSVPMAIDNQTVQGIGELYTNPQNLIKITRLTIYEEKPVTLNVYMWD